MAKEDKLRPEHDGEPGEVQDDDQEETSGNPGPSPGDQQSIQHPDDTTDEPADEPTEESGDATTDLVAMLQEENSELKNQLLRKQAEFENYRKRMIRDREEAVQYSNRQLLLDLTTVIDDFERAIASADESHDYDAFHNGVVLIEKQLTGMLERKWGLKRFESEGQEFDPQRHEAVTTEPREDLETSVVLEDYQKGYTLHERVLRSAKVKVSMPAGQ